MKIAIYCGSSFGNNKIYEQKATLLAQKLYENKIEMVYGGSVQGLMGIVSNESLRLGNKVTGVITHDLAYKEIENKAISEIYKVHTINERKEKMEELSDGFITLPGGYGTFEEIFEVISLAQMGYHQKPSAFVNINGYYDLLIEFLQNCVKEGFINQRFVDMLIVSDDIDEIISRIKNYTPPPAKWDIK